MASVARHRGQTQQDDPLKILVTGGRGYADAEAVSGTLDFYVSLFGNFELINGGATGADYLAREWFRERYQRDPITVEADWDSLHRAAGSIRNQKMLDDHRPDLVIAFPGGAGTADMIIRAEAANIPVIKIC